jgi:iron complex transport system substrate-binding protein
MALTSKTAYGIVSVPILLLLAISASLAVVSAVTYDLVVPGDLDGDLIVSDEELEAAQSSYDNGEITSEELEEIKQINENYPRIITDMAGREVTLYKPVERIIVTYPDSARMVIALGAGDLIVGADSATVTWGGICPTINESSEDEQLACKECWETVVSGGLDNLPVVASSGPSGEPNYELMAELRPDLIFPPIWSAYEADDIEERVGAPVFVAGPNFTYESLINDALAVGEVLSREEEAEEFISLVDSKVKMVTDVTDSIPDSEKPTVYFAPRGGKTLYDARMGRDFTRTVNTYYPLIMAGGINVAKDCPGGDDDLNVALEQIIAWDPDVILLAGSDVDFIMNSPDLQSVRAVQEGRVYTVFPVYSYGYPHDKNLLNVLLIAKILYPDEFADVDLEEEGNEIMKAFVGVDGVFTDYANDLVWPRGYLNSE